MEGTTHFTMQVKENTSGNSVQFYIFPIKILQQKMDWIKQSNDYKLVAIFKIKYKGELVQKSRQT
jgi:hypothetical protein